MTTASNDFSERPVAQIDTVQSPDVASNIPYPTAPQCGVHVIPRRQGAMLRTLIQSCGLTHNWVGQHSRQNVDSRTVARWTTDHSWVPDDVIDLVSKVDALLTRKAAELVNQIDGWNGGPSNPVELWQYRGDGETERMWREHPDLDTLPVTAFLAIVDRARLELQRRGRSVIVSYIPTLHSSQEPQHALST